MRHLHRCLLEKDGDTDRATRLVSVVLLVALVLLSTVMPAQAVVLGSDLMGHLSVSALPEDVARLAPDIGAAAGTLVTSDGQVLWARNPDAPRAMASATKIMSAVVALENADLDEPVRVSERAAATGQASARLQPGGTYSLETLLEAMLVRSGNDAAVAVAEHVGGSVEGFADMMNAKAGELGLDQTSFRNPHGLDADGHHSSAADLATLARYAMAKPEIRRMVVLDKVIIDGVAGPVELENSNLLIGSLEGATGLKTGWTSKAGFCLLASAERDGIELFAVVLGASDEMERFRQAALLLEWGFVHYSEKSLAKAGEVLATLPVSDYLDVSVDAIVGEPARLPVFDIAGEVTRAVSLPETLDAPVMAGDRVGTLSLVQGEHLIAQVPVVAANDVRRPTLPERWWIALVRAWRAVFGEPAVVLALR